MIERELLVGVFHKGEAQAIYKRLKGEREMLSFARKFLSDGDVMVQRKAMWALLQCNSSELKDLQPLYNELVDLAMQTQNSSLKRMAMSIVERLAINEKNLRTDFLDFCLDRMVDLKENSAIQSLAMKLAYKMCCLFPELKMEFLRTVEFMEVDYYKPALKSVIRSVLKKERRPKK